MYSSLYEYFMRVTQKGDYTKCLEGETMKSAPTQKELTDAVKKVWGKLGGTISVILLAILPSVAAVTSDTLWQDVPPTNKLGDVFSAVGTNASSTVGCRYLAPWNCPTGKPAVTLTNVTYKAGDAYIVSSIKGPAVYRHSIVMSGLIDGTTSPFTDVSYYFTNSVATQYAVLQSLADAMRAAGVGDKDAGSIIATGTVDKGSLLVNIDHVGITATPASITLIRTNESQLQESVGIVSSISSISDTVELISGGTTNYRPTGSAYAQAASTEVENQDVQLNDTYVYDGSVWKLLSTDLSSRTTFQQATNAAVGAMSKVRINGQQLSENVSITTFAAFPSTWRCSGCSMDDLCVDIGNDSSAVPGMCFLGELSGVTPMPDIHLGNCEVIVKICTEGVFNFEVYSTDTGTKHWDGVGDAGGFIEWRQVVTAPEVTANGEYMVKMTVAYNGQSKNYAWVPFSTPSGGYVSTNALQGQTFDFSTMNGVYSGLKAVIEKLGGTVNNAPASN